MSVSVSDLETAIEWLGINEGEAGEHESCQRVIEFLRAEISKRDRASLARAVGKKLGRHVTPGMIKDRLK